MKEAQEKSTPPKRPMGAYLFFLEDCRVKWKARFPGQKLHQRSLCATAGKAWAAMPLEERAHYVRLSDASKAAWAAYMEQQRGGRGGHGRRRSPTVQESQQEEAEEEGEGEEVEAGEQSSPTAAGAAGGSSAAGPATPSAVIAALHTKNPSPPPGSGGGSPSRSGGDAAAPAEHWRPSTAAAGCSTAAPRSPATAAAAVQAPPPLSSAQRPSLAAPAPWHYVGWAASRTGSQRGPAPPPGQVQPGAQRQFAGRGVATPQQPAAAIMAQQQQQWRRVQLWRGAAASPPGMQAASKATALHPQWLPPQDVSAESEPAPLLWPGPSVPPPGDGWQAELDELLSTLVGDGQGAGAGAGGDGAFGDEPQAALD